MKTPDLPPDEIERLRALRAAAILDTPPEERFDRFTRLARRLFDVPIVLVSLVDEHRQWFKSIQGLGATETPRDISFCGHSIHESRAMVVPDALEDERFADNPLVCGDPRIRFYAGCPLRTHDGHALGTLCLIDREPRVLDAEELDLLRDLADMVEQEFTAHRQATTDELTRISNRRGFNTIAAHSMALCRRHKIPGALLFFDLDDFKPINDIFGHAEGDTVLIRFAAFLVETFREADVVARLGGDEFGVLCAGTDEAGLDAPLARLVAQLERDRVEQRRPYALKFSVGSAGFQPSDTSTVLQLMERADANMYERKRAVKRADKRG